jgi:hypothetical protein
MPSIESSHIFICFNYQTKEELFVENLVYKYVLSDLIHNKFNINMKLFAISAVLALFSSVSSWSVTL